MTDSNDDAAREMDAAARAGEYAAQSEAARAAAAEIERRAAQDAIDNAQNAPADPPPASSE
jgi:Arc/MetJ-type ribon-helix-helix transcriptional regulator